MVNGMRESEVFEFNTGGNLFWGIGILHSTFARQERSGRISSGVDFDRRFFVFIDMGN